MSEVNLKFNIHLNISESDLRNNTLLTNTLENKVVKCFCPPRYQIYVDNDLITERSWVWKDSITCLQESIWVNLNKGVSIIKLSRLPSLKYNQSGINGIYSIPQINTYNFSIKNLLVNDRLTSVDTPIISNQGRDIEVSFSI